MAESSEEKMVDIVCPICSSRSKVPVPSYIFEKKKAGIIKIQIHPGIVCNHQFVAFVDQKFVARGYERIDFELDISPRAPRPETMPELPQIFLTDVVSKFGTYATSFLMHAQVFNFPTFLVVSPTDAPNLASSLNELFSSMMPDELEHDPLITQMDRKQYMKLKVISSEHLVLDTNGIVFNSPWGEKKRMTFEENALALAMKVDDEKLQAGRVRSEVTNLYRRAKFAYELLQKEDHMYEADLKNAVGKEFGIKVSDYQLDLILLMVRRRFKGGEPIAKKVHIRSFDKLKEGLW